MNIKTILGVAAVAFGGSLFLGGRKFSGYKNVLENLEVNIKNVKGIKLQGSDVLFNVDVELVNPTSTAVNIPGNLLLVKNIHFYTPSGAFLGTATPNISNIAMPAKGARLITNIPTRVSLASIGKSFTEVLDVVLDPTKLRTGADLEAFGQSFTIEA